MEIQVSYSVSKKCMLVLQLLMVKMKNPTCLLRDSYCLIKSKSTFATTETVQYDFIILIEKLITCQNRMHGSISINTVIIYRTFPLIAVYRFLFEFSRCTCGSNFFYDMPIGLSTFFIETLQHRMFLLLRDLTRFILFRVQHFLHFTKVFSAALCKKKG